MSLKEFIVAGHSHIYCMGAPRNHAGPVAMAPSKIGTQEGHFLVGSGPRHQAYWQMLLENSAGKDVVISWNGNQHWVSFLFQPAIPFDFLEPTLPNNGSALRDGTTVVPRRLIKAFFQPTIDPLVAILKSLQVEKPNSVTVLGNPPPCRDISTFERSIRSAPYWREMAARCGLDLSAAAMTPEPIVLKLWAVTQEILRETTEKIGLRFFAVPSATQDDSGFLLDRYKLDKDFTHANNAWGESILKQALAELA